MPKRAEYTEGPQAAENFERMATAVFKAKKTDGRKLPDEQKSSQPPKGNGVKTRRTRTM